MDWVADFCTELAGDEASEGSEDEVWHECKEWPIAELKHNESSGTDVKVNPLPGGGPTCQSRCEWLTGIARHLWMKTFIVTLDVTRVSSHGGNGSKPNLLPYEI